jgi:hypothetical protein
VILSGCVAQRLLAELGCEVVVGGAAQLLQLLLEERFPKIWCRAWKNDE